MDISTYASVNPITSVCPTNVKLKFGIEGTFSRTWNPIKPTRNIIPKSSNHFIFFTSDSLLKHLLKFWTLVITPFTQHHLSSTHIPISLFLMETQIPTYSTQDQ